MQAHRVETTVATGGTVKITGLPLRVGASVEVIVLVQQDEPERRTAEKYPLRGKPYRLDAPTAPVAADDWDAAG